jgi:A/G-specific adenine glycosylase
VVVDANVERVVSRLFAVTEPLPGSRPTLRRHADAITPELRAGDFAQAMMDLGATICTSKAPRCLLCPLSAVCVARATGAPEQFPFKTPKKPRPQRQGRAFWIVRDDAVWLIRRPDKGMLGGMRALADDGWNARSDGSGQAPLAGRWEPGGVVAHGFTHFGLDLHVLVYRGNDWAGLDALEGEWWPLSRIEEAGLPTLFAKAARLALTLTGEVA